MKVLIVANECGPGEGHVAGASWQIISRLSKQHDIWVIAEENSFKDSVESYLSLNPDALGNVFFSFIKDHAYDHGSLSRSPIPLAENLSYRQWLKEACTVAKKLHTEHAFDVVHHLRSNTFREPSSLWELEVPYVWGPMGGTTRVPWKLLSSMSAKGALQHVFRNLITELQFSFSMRVRKAVKKSSVIFNQTSFDQLKFERKFNITTQLVHEQATLPELSRIRSYKGNGPLELVWVGRLVASKAIKIALRAIAETGNADHILLHIVGDGPERETAEGLANQLGIASSCVWHGWVQEVCVVEMLQQKHALLFTSLLEATATTVTLALSCGAPIICLHHCGFGDITDGRCALKIPVGFPREVVSGFAATINTLLDEPERIERMSNGAAAVATNHSWDHLANRINEAYQLAVTKNGPGVS